MDAHYLGYVAAFLSSIDRIRCLWVCREWRYASCLAPERTFLKYQETSDQALPVALGLHDHDRIEAMSSLVSLG